MTRAFTALTFTDTVKTAQARNHSRDFCAALEAKDPPNDALTEPAARQIQDCDSFMIGTASSEGWPHVQHRGGPKGFLRILDPRTLAFADYRGNRQYITVGNLAENSRAILFLLDYRQRRRLKIWGWAEVIEDDPDLIALLADDAYPATIERVIRIKVAAWDFNCPQHIPVRLEADEYSARAEECERRLVELQNRYATFDLLPAHE